MTFIRAATVRVGRHDAEGGFAPPMIFEDNRIAFCYNDPMKTVTYSRDAARDLRKYGNVAAPIRKAMGEYAADQTVHANNVKQLVSSSQKRMRVGDFRMLFDETDTGIVVTKVAPRGGVYD